MNQSDRTLLIKMAAEMVTNQISIYPDDWDLSKSTPQKDRRKIFAQAMVRNDIQHRWSRTIMDILKRIDLTNTPQANNGRK